MRAAVDHVHVKPEAPPRRRARGRLLPADDGRLSDGGERPHRRREDFDVAAEIAALTAGRAGYRRRASPSRGSAATRAGASPPSSSSIIPGMAEAEIARVVAEAAARWPLLRLTVIHRFGRDRARASAIVLVVAAAAHRGAAFEAAEFLMDYLKTRAPFWKREHLADGTAGPGSRRRSRTSAPPAAGDP